MTHANAPFSLSRRSALFAAGVLALGGSLGGANARRDAHADTGPLVIQGVSIATLCSGESMQLAGRALTMLRVSLAPGTDAVATSVGRPVALIVESGVLEIDLLNGEGIVTRALVDGMWAGYRNMVAGDSTRLATGDHLFHDGANHALRNVGSQTLVMLVSLIHDAGVPARA